MTPPFLAALLLTAAQAAEFPIGLYNVPTPPAAAAAAAAGFTHVLAAEGDAASAARRRGLKVIGFPDAAPGSPSAPGPSPVAAWYISDEPEVNRQTPADVARIAQQVRSREPGTPLVLVVGDGRRAGDYAASVDALMVDWYPVPHLPLTGVGEHVSAAVSQAAGKPVWAVVQAMDWRDYPQRDPKKPRVGRFPTLTELRFMAFHAVIRGAGGVFFFEMQRRSVPGETLLDYPERWQALETVAMELRALKPFFESGAGEALTAPGLEGRAWSLRGRRLVILVNPGAKAGLLPPTYRDAAWRVLFKPSLWADRAFPSGRLPGFGIAVLVGR